jgi:hypothetical protein
MRRQTLTLFNLSNGNESVKNDDGNILHVYIKGSKVLRKLKYSEVDFFKW